MKINTKQLLPIPVERIEGKVGDFARALSRFKKSGWDSFVFVGEMYFLRSDGERGAEGGGGDRARRRRGQGKRGG